MDIYTDSVLRAKLRELKPGTPIISSSGGFIGHVIGFASKERDCCEWKQSGRFIYRIQVSWMTIDWADPEISVVDLADVELL
jgi:hypothetical protein